MFLFMTWLNDFLYADVKISEKMSSGKKLSAEEREALLRTLKARFEKNMKRHETVLWSSVEKRLAAAGDKLLSLSLMEGTGGEPDVTGTNPVTGEILFCDCSAETPKGRRSLCYDRESLESRKEFKPAGSAMDMAAEIGVEMLDEEQYRELQRLGKYDEKSSSWLRTPVTVRKLGGAIFGDRRYDTVFTYHNGAESYYAARGFRGMLRV